MAFSWSVPISSQSQNYNLVDTGKVWTNTSCGWGWAVSCVTNYYKMDQDTTIGSFSYKGVWFSGDSGLVSPNWYLQGFVREDSSRKVYYRNTSDTQDYAIYDFGVTTGDTAHLIYNYMPLNLVVDSTSSILIQGQPRTVYYLHDIQFMFAYNQTWIEGIGSLDELLILRAPQVDYSSDLLCFHENDTLKYFDPNYTDCYFNSVGIGEYRAENQISFSPNPTDGKFTINFSTSTYIGEATLFFTDVTGKIISQQHINFEEKTEINLSEFSPGLYFVMITGKGFNPLLGKIAVY